MSETTGPEAKGEYMKATNQFQAKVNEIRVLLAQGNVKGATDVLNQAWNLAGEVQAQRTIAHGLGNEIQKALFAQYAQEHGYNLESN